MACPLTTNVKNPDVCRPEPPFWWLSQDIDREPRNPDNGDFYTTVTKFKEVEKDNILGAMRLDNTEEYIPGEIHQNQKQQLQLGETICQQIIRDGQWTPKSPDFYKAFDVNSVPRADNYLYNMVKKRQQLDLASTLKEDSDYSLKDGSEVPTGGRPVHSTPQPRASLPVSDNEPAQRRLPAEHFFCECHQHHSLPKTNLLSKTTVCEKCGCEYIRVDTSKVDASRRIMAAISTHITGTNPYCFRDVIGRN